MITYNPERKTFKLDTKDSSYIFGMNEDGILLHYYYGKKLGEDAVAYLAVADGATGVTARPHYAPGSSFSLDLVPQEYPTFGAGDHRPSALRIRDGKGNPTTLIHYESHDIYAGKPKIPGMPATYGGEDEVMTLEIHTVDRLTEARVTLFYSVFSDSSVMTRHARIENKSETPLDIESAQSACVDYNTCDFDVITLYGHAVREREIERTPLSHGIHGIASLRGSSSHNFNPFMAVVAHDATEQSGEAYGYNLVYSGNFRMDAAVDG
ncbi:MAG: alpha-galactosidase, partial [Clostridia bacterium]|nr:alpha-galactosidase [Clostridia bacterium]